MSEFKTYKVQVNYLVNVPANWSVGALERYIESDVVGFLYVESNGEIARPVGVRVDVSEAAPPASETGDSGITREGPLFRHCNGTEDNHIARIETLNEKLDALTAELEDAKRDPFAEFRELGYGVHYHVVDDENEALVIVPHDDGENYMLSTDSEHGGLGPKTLGRLSRLLTALGKRDGLHD